MKRSDRKRARRAKPVCDALSSILGTPVDPEWCRRRVDEVWHHYDHIDDPDDRTERITRGLLAEAEHRARWPPVD